MTLVFKAGQRRPETATKTAFVLSGGGNHGSAQVGMLRALLERGIIPDVIIGTSAGALNGSGVAANPSLAGVDHLAEIWSALRTEHIFPGGRFGRAWSLLSGGDHLYSNAGLAGLIDQMAPASKFSQLAIPLRVVACDLATGEEVVLASGPLKPALLASAALPGSFPPVLHDHRTLVDGGVVDNVPLSHALAGPVDRIFVLNVSGGVADAPSATRSTWCCGPSPSPGTSASSGSWPWRRPTSRSRCSPARPTGARRSTSPGPRPSSTRPTSWLAAS